MLVSIPDAWLPGLSSVPLDHVCAQPYSPHREAWALVQPNPCTTSHPSLPQGGNTAFGISLWQGSVLLPVRVIFNLMLELVLGLQY